MAKKKAIKPKEATATIEHFKAEAELMYGKKMMPFIEKMINKIAKEKEQGK